MTLTFEPELDVAKVKPHPANPRRKAIADSEMVDSIREKGLVQPIAVAPAESGDGWILLAGHRRLDGCRKAKLKTVPAIVHAELGTDAEQLEFAIIENVHREDLSPIEEAEAYHQFSLMRDPSTRKPYTLPAIARKTGRPVASIRDRLKLLKLSKKTTEKVHKGQLTIGDALQLVALEDDPKLQAHVAKQAGSTSFKHALESATRKIKAQHKVDQIAEALLAAGYAEFAAGETIGDTWALTRKHGDAVEILVRTYEGGDLADHAMTPPHRDAGCLGFVRLAGDQWITPHLVLVCNDPAKHRTAEDEETAQARADADAEREREHAERRAREEAKDVARTLRTTTVMQHVGPTLDGPVVDVLRTLLPALIWDIDDDTSLATYGRLMNLGVVWAGYHYSRSDDDRQLFEDHVEQLTSGSTTYVTKALVSLLLARAERWPGNFRPRHTSNRWYESTFDLRYLELLEGLGHDFCDVDEEIRDNAAPSPSEEGAA